MPFNSLVRLFSISAVALAARSGVTEFNSVFVSIGLSHYALAFVYSRKQIGALLTNGNRLWAAALIAAGFLITRFQVPDIVLYFGLHHMLTETYLWPASRSAAGGGPLLAARFCFNGFAYGFILRRYVFLQPVPAAVWAAGFCVSALAFFFLFFKERRRVPPGEWNDQLLFEAAGTAAVLASLFINFTFRQVILYHFIAWFFLPLPKMAARNRAGTGRYLLWMAGLTGLFWILTPAGGGFGSISPEKLEEQVILWGYIHITASFALSSLNPSWLSRFFALSAKGSEPALETP